MIHGLEHFKNYFNRYGDSFIIVGGIASYLLLEKVGSSKIRATKDIDLVLLMNPTDEFLRAFDQYIKKGRYEIQQGNESNAKFYRFQKPKDESYPVMIELFSAMSKDFNLFENQHIIPINTPEDVDSLSAILLDQDYYTLIKDNATVSKGINILNYYGLIIFKAKAYLDIKKRKDDSKNWKKHRGDIINLAVSYLDEDSNIKLKDNLKNDFAEFIRQLKQELTPDIIKGACGQKFSSDDIIMLLENVFLK